MHVKQFLGTVTLFLSSMFCVGQSTAAKPFREGAIKVDITTPGSLIGGLLQQVDPTKGNTQQQLMELSAGLSEADRKRFQKEAEETGILLLAIVNLPLKSMIYCKGENSTAKFDALNYHGENTVDMTKKEGKMYMKASAGTEQVNILYTGENLYRMSATVLNNEDYTITRTAETITVAGYPCTKAVYTLKGAPAGGPDRASMVGVDPKPYQVEVWTSTLMPGSLNFMHPLYIEENAGIMKLLVQFDRKTPFKLLYQFSQVESRAVTTAEMAIQEPGPVYDYEKDMMTIAGKLLKITFGGGMQSESGEEEN
ncbi:MAG: hypothetical protein P0Y53_05940 [Candidatus Pseudobacter hemicellulosilyticus]|uniref:DUF4412 domain-containing protein n=1 Tax=Candidatus Pseudobacter hemicellulosilyticus TaxID=3121375 RepID=A0AAJ5WWT4_9BACT|nr:MAG: hypothetical protein P0Y53_05940 [Pseudobacter sp.]